MTPEYTAEQQKIQGCQEIPIQTRTRTKKRGTQGNFSNNAAAAAATACRSTLKKEKFSHRDRCCLCNNQGRNTSKPKRTPDQPNNQSIQRGNDRNLRYKDRGRPIRRTNAASSPLPNIPSLTPQCPSDHSRIQNCHGS